MFYSHEILTSPEHGVATIWLVATLGSRSITRRVNRKAILNVDVPEACSVIINPEAPMALRLQGSLLYGVSRVYHQQCGYTLLDVQSMHDRMTSMLKLMPDGGLDPTAGKTRPSSLIVPYDPAFLPETGLPGIAIDLTFLSERPDESSSQLPVNWTKSPVDSLTSASHHGSVQIELPSDDGLQGVGMQDLDSDLNVSTEKHGLFGMPRSEGGKEEGVLLQPDFEFDADGNIVEFHESHLSPRKRRKLNDSLQVSEGPTADMVMEDSAIAMPGEDIRIEANDIMDLDLNERHTQIPEEHNAEVEDLGQPEAVQTSHARRAQRTAKALVSDDKTTLRNTDLALWNDEYLANMARASKQKQQNKMQTIVKKNAAFWVFGQGIGSVGVGLGVHHDDHPLKFYSGKELYEVLSSGVHRNGRNHANGSDGDGETDTNARNKDDQGRQEPPDVELGRQGPPSLMDEHSSQMPWNITASVQSSQRGRLGSMSDFSARGVQDSSGRLGSRTRGRLTSASPLAGRGYLEGRERLDSLNNPGHADDELDDLERMEITKYLEGELAADHEDISTISRCAVAAARATSTLDQESLNFLEFIQTRVDASTDSGHILFSSLLPPKETTRTVATQGLMNVLTLATKGVLTVSQEAYRTDVPSANWGARYHYGEIHLRLPGE